MADLTIRTDEKIRLSVGELFNDNVKRPTTEVARWSSSNPSIAAIKEVSSNGGEATVVGLAVGTVTITVQADTLSKTTTIEVKLPPTPTATALEILASIPEKKKPPFGNFPT